MAYDLVTGWGAPKRCSCPQRNRNWRRERQSPTGRADKMLAILLLLLAVRTGAVDLVLTLPQDGDLTVSVDILDDELEVDVGQPSKPWMGHAIQGVM